MTPEQIDEMMKKTLEERKVRWLWNDAYLMCWENDTREGVIICTGNPIGRGVKSDTFSVFPSNLSPIAPPEPTRVRFKIGRKGSAYSSASDVEDVYAKSSIDYTHECNLDDCYKPGEDFCSFKEMADAGVQFYSRYGRYIVRIENGECARDFYFDPVNQDIAYAQARRYASKLVRKRQGRLE